MSNSLESKHKGGENAFRLARYSNFTIKVILVHMSLVYYLKYFEGLISVL